MNVLNLLRRSTPEVLAAQELDEAKRSLLEAHSAAEYASSMARYHQARIKRLQDYLQSTTKDAESQDAV